MDAAALTAMGSPLSKAPLILETWACLSLWKFYILAPTTINSNFFQLFLTEVSTNSRYVVPNFLGRWDPDDKGWTKSLLGSLSIVENQIIHSKDLGLYRQKVGSLL